MSYHPSDDDSDAEFRFGSASPADYYETKAQLARRLREELAQAEAALNAARVEGQWKRVPRLGSEVARIKAALERAEYVGD